MVRNVAPALRGPMERRLRRRRLLVLVSAVLGVAGVYGLGVLTARGQRVERRFLDASVFEQHAPLLTVVSVPHLLIAAAAVALLGVLAGRRLMALVAVSVVAVCNVLGQLFKHVILVRPALDGEDPNTFPSGHMIAFASVAAGLLMTAPPRARSAVAAGSGILLSIVGGQLLYYGWHRPSDIAGAMMLVTAVSAFALMLAGPHGAQPDPPGRPLAEPVLAVAGAAAVLAAVAAGFAHRAGLLPEGPWVTVIAVCGLSGVALLTVTANLWLLRTGARPPVAAGASPADGLPPGGAGRAGAQGSTSRCE